MIEFKNLTKTFHVPVKEPGLWASIKAVFAPKTKEKRALDSVSARIGEGEILGLIGANGAGKTTLVKILSGIVHPTSGELSVFGHVPFERKNAFRKDISLVMGQKAQLWWDLAAADCFLLLKEIYQLEEKAYRSQLSLLVDSLGVSSELNVPIRRLSLGERMKMELIASLLHQPKVVFLDEPTIGLDFTAQRAVRTFIRDYQREKKATILLTSHYLDDIEQLCPRVIVIRKGRFVFDGNLETLKNQEKGLLASLEEVMTGESEAAPVADEGR